MSKGFLIRAFTPDRAVIRKNYTLFLLFFLLNNKKEPMSSIIKNFCLQKCIAHIFWMRPKKNLIMIQFVVWIFTGSVSYVLEIYCKKVHKIIKKTVITYHGYYAFFALEKKDPDPTFGENTDPTFGENTDPPHWYTRTMMLCWVHEVWWHCCTGDRQDRSHIFTPPAPIHNWARNTRWA